MVAAHDTSPEQIRRRAALGGIAVSVAIGAAFLSNVDRAVMSGVVALRHGWATAFFKGIYVLGDEAVAGPVVALALVGLARGRRWRDALGLAIATGGVLVWVDLVLKPLFDRHRPGELIVRTAGTAFPSGHVAGNLVLYLFLAALVAEHAPAAARLSHRAAWLWVLLQGLCAVYLGAHFPTDVVAGVGVGLLWLSVMQAWRDRRGASRA